MTQRPLPDSYRSVAVPKLETFVEPEPLVRRLANGVRIYCMEDHDLPLVSISMRLGAGTVEDPAGLPGVAGSLGEMLRLGGSARFPGDWLDEHLASLGTEIQTWADLESCWGSAECTTFVFPEVMEILFDVWNAPSAPEDKLELIRTQHRAEIARRNDQLSEIASRAFLRAMYGADSPLAREPELPHVDALTRDALLQYHRDYYCSDRLLIGVVGDVEPQTVVKSIERLTASWPREQRPLDKHVLDPLPIGAVRVFTVEKKDSHQTAIYIGGESVRRDDPDWPALSLGSRILGLGSGSPRMMKKVRTQLGLAYSVGGGFYAGFRHRGRFACSCQTKTESTRAALDAMLGEIRRMAEEPPTADEVAGAKEEILNASVFDSDSRAKILGRRINLELHGYPHDYVEQYYQRIERLTADDVGAAFRRHLDPGKLTIVAAGRAREFGSSLAGFGPVEAMQL